MTEITLPSSRKIGAGHDPFIIAEVGSNWETFEHCKDSINLAKACGADAVKFQLYDKFALYGSKEVLNNLAPMYGDKVDMLGQLNPEWLPKLKIKADAAGIELMCSAFSPELQDEVNKHVNIHKLASAENNHVRMLERLRAYGKPVIMSTGASGERDLRASLEILGDTPTVLLYCVASYPAQAVNLDTIPLMQKTFNVSVGFSDHTLDILTIPRMAVEKGACVIEKHVNFFGVQGPDSPHSLSTDQFKRMVKNIKTPEEPRIGYTGEENEMVLRHNRRLKAIRDIKAGEVFVEGDNFGIYRSLQDDIHAFSPFAVNQVDRAIAKRDINAGQGIGPNDI